MSEEQRQKLKEEKVNRRIQRVTDADILNAAKIKAEEIYKHNQINKNSENNAIWISLQDSLTNSYAQQMQQAYQYAFDQKLALNDNIQELGNGKIVFTKPGIQADSIPGFWMILLDKKEVIKALD